MKILFVGDLHAKYDILEKVKELSKTYDKVVFLGDYVDDWDAMPEASYNLLNSLIEFKLDNPDKVKLLLGNHDLSEWFGTPFMCSAYNQYTSALVGGLFSKHEDLFDIACLEGGLLCSHAGFTKSWVEKYLDSPKSTLELVDTINYDFHHRKEEACEKNFLGLSDVGYARGGRNDDPSPLWADCTELIADWYPVPQVVGHTPHRTITFYNMYDEEIYFCDTFSTYRDGTCYGNNTLLAIEDKCPVRIDLSGKELPWNS